MSKSFCYNAMSTNIETNNTHTMYENKHTKGLVPLDGKYSIKGHLLSKNRLISVCRCTDSELEFCVEFFPTNRVSDRFTLKGPYLGKNAVVVCHPVLSDNSRNKKLIYKDTRRYPIDCDVSHCSNNSSEDHRYVTMGKNFVKIPPMRKDQTPCEYLNQFSSVFVDNIKDPIPKDPLTRPRVYNNYPRTVTQDKYFQINRQSISSTGKKKNHNDIRYVVDDDGSVTTKSKNPEPGSCSRMNKEGNCKSEKEERPACCFCCLPCFI